MTRFDRVLSDGEVHNLFALNNEVFCADSEGDFYTREGINPVDTVCLFEIGRNIEQAVLAKLAEQEPVAWVIDGSKGPDNSYVTQREAEAKAMISLGSEVKPLYTHPMPSSQGLLDNSNHVVGNTEMVTPLAQRKIQTLLDKGEYREIENATVLVNENGHAAIVNRGGAFYWVDNEALAREFDAAPKHTGEK